MLSLIIIIVSGLFVGMVLGLQGYETLQKVRSSAAFGTLSRSLSRASCARRGRAAGWRAARDAAMTSEIGLMKATDQISAMG